MSAMNLNNVKASFDSPHSSIRKRLCHPMNLLNGQLLRQRMIIRKRNRTRSHNVLRPPSHTLRRERLLRSPPNPRRKRTRFPARMRQLNRSFRTLAVDEIGDALQRRNLRIRPEPGVAGGDAAAGLDGGGFEGDEAGAVEGELAEVDEVPVCDVAVLRAVSAHGGDDEAVVDRHAAHAERLEERWCR